MSARQLLADAVIFVLCTCIMAFAISALVFGGICFCLPLMVIVVEPQPLPDQEEFHGHAETDDGSLLWFDGKSPENISSWEWDTHGANGRTWKWDTGNGTTWTTWVWSSTSTDPQADNHGGGFLLSASPSPSPSVPNVSGRSEAQIDGTRNCSPCGGAAWVLRGPVLTWTTPPPPQPQVDYFPNCGKWMMQQGNHCWGFTSKPSGAGAGAVPAWGFIFENVTVTGNKGGPGIGACAFPSTTFTYPDVHTHGLGDSGGLNNGLGGPVGLGGGFWGFGPLGFGGFPGLGWLGFGGWNGLFQPGILGFSGGMKGFRSGFGFRGVTGGDWGWTAGQPGGLSLNGVSSCPQAGGFLFHRYRREADADADQQVVDDALAEGQGQGQGDGGGGQEEEEGKKPKWGAGIKRWLRRARDFLSSVIKASSDDEGKSGWTIPIGGGYIEVGPHLLKKVSGWIGGAVLSVLGGSTATVDPESREAIEAMLLDPNIVETIHNATAIEESSTIADEG